MFGLTFSLSFLEGGKSEASWNTLFSRSSQHQFSSHRYFSFQCISNTLPNLSRFSISGAIEKAPSVVKLGVPMRNVPSIFAKGIGNAAAPHNQLVKNPH